MGLANSKLLARYIPKLYRNVFSMNTETASCKRTIVSRKVTASTVVLFSLRLMMSFLTIFLSVYFYLNENEKKLHKRTDVMTGT